MEKKIIQKINKLIMLKQEGPYWDFKKNSTMKNISQIF